MQGIIVLTSYNCCRTIANVSERTAYTYHTRHIVVISFKVFKCMYFCYNVYTCTPKRINKKKAYAMHMYSLTDFGSIPNKAFGTRCTEYFSSIQNTFEIIIYF